MIGPLTVAKGEQTMSPRDAGSGPTQAKAEATAMRRQLEAVQARGR